MENIVDKVAGTLGDEIHNVHYKGEDFDTFLAYCEDYLIDYVGEETPYGESGNTEQELIFSHQGKHYSVKIHNISWNRYAKQYYFIDMWEKAKNTYKEVEPILPTNGIIDEEWINRGSVVKDGKKIVSEISVFSPIEEEVTLEQLVYIKNRLQVKGYQTDQFIFEVLI